MRRRPFSLQCSWGIQARKPEGTEIFCASYQELELDQFQMISHWYHFAILSLAGLKNNSANPDWIADRLGISAKEAGEGFQRLLRLKLVKKKGAGFIRDVKPLWVSTDRSSGAIRNYHFETLEKAKTTLEEGQGQLELYSSITMLADESQLESARPLIKKFRDRLCKHLESGNGQRVYTLAVQLFPVSNNRGESHGTPH